ncbi:MAG: carbamoyl-phosphate synthase large subunit, partial [Bacteriovoracales bacterium]|nr:carbamoyl-phosphate synthase large subunit [Bacteriovoracales bacterium]
ETQKIYEITGIDPWFLKEIAKIVRAEARLLERGLPMDPLELLSYKKMGFSDARLAELTRVCEREVRRLRYRLNVLPVYKRVDTCAGEFESQTTTLYSTYEGDGLFSPECEARPSRFKKVIILGSGPNRIGQGIEFDYSCVHGAKALGAMGYETIMVNCNPETVSTDNDISRKLYFAPLGLEFVLDIIQKEEKEGELCGVIVQFGGQTPLQLARDLERAGVKILGTPPDSIDLAEDRERFRKLLLELELGFPESAICHKVCDLPAVVRRFGHPVLVRPSNVLGGRAMAILKGEDELEDYLAHHRLTLMEGPILVDRFLEGAIEVDVDAVSDGEEVAIAGIMEHIERVGIHSGDSACVLPPLGLSRKVICGIEQKTTALAKALGVVGPLNVQYAVCDDEIIVLEANPRASRTVPFVAKATGVPWASLAAQVMVGRRLSDFSLPDSPPSRYSVKEAVFPFARFPGADILLGPEMKSTGEAMGSDGDAYLAYAKAQVGAMGPLPERERGMVVTAYGKHLEGLEAELIQEFGRLGFRALSLGDLTEWKVGKEEGVDRLMGLGQITWVACVEGGAGLASFRRLLVLNKISYVTTHEAALWTVKALKSLGVDHQVIPARL